MDISTPHILNKHYQPGFLTVTPNTAAITVIQQMNHTQTSCALVVEQQELVGIFTTQDVVRLVAHQTTCEDTPIAAFMTQPVITLSEQEAEDLLTVLEKFQQHNLCHLPVINEEGKVLGVATPGSVNATVAKLKQEIVQQQHKTQLAHASAARLNDILNNAIATSITSLRVFPNYDWVYDYQSPGCESLFGYTAEEIINDKNLWMSRVYPQDVEMVIMPLFEEIIAGHTINHVEYRFKHKDGSLRWICAIYTSRYDADVNCWIVTGNSSDISKRKQVEASLQESEARFNHLAANSPGMIYTYVQRPDDFIYFEYLSSAFEQIQEIKCEQALQDAMLCFAQIHPDDIQGCREAISKSYQSLEPFSHEWRIITPSGKLKWLQAKSVPERRNNGDVAWYGVALDVSENKRVQAELQEQKQFIEQIINHSPQLLYIFDPITGSNIYLNQQSVEILGYTPEEIQQRGANFFLDVLHPDDLHLLARNFNYWKNASEDAVLTTEFRMQHKNGTWRWLRSREVIFARNENNLPTKVLGTTQDITERKQAELEIIHSRDLREAIFNESADALFLVDAETFLTTDCNRRAVELFAASDKTELIGIAGHTLHKHEFNPDEFTSMIEAIHQQGCWSHEVEYLTKQGNSFWGNLAITQIQVAGEKIYLVRVTDISQRKQAEAALQESEERWQLAIAGTNEAIWDWNIVTNQTFRSARWFEMLGYEGSEITYSHEEWSSRIHPEDYERVIAAQKAYLGRQIPEYKVEYRLRCQDGNYKWFQSRAKAIWNQEGNPVRLVGSIGDISDVYNELCLRQRAEETLRHSEALLAESQQVARLGSWEYDLETGKITWSQGLFDLFDRDPARGEPSYDENLRLYYPEDAAKLHQFVVQAIATGESYKLILRVPESDGSYRYFDAIGHAQLNANGQVIRLYGTAQDVTERVQAEMSLKESELRFREIFNNTFQLTGLLTVDGIVIEVNQTALTFGGLTREDVMNRPFWDTYWWTISPQTQEQLKQAIALAAQGEFVRYQVDVLAANHQIATIDFTLRPLRDEAGKIVLLIPEGRDISEEQAALRDRQRAEQALQEKEAFLSSIYNGVGESIFVIDILDDFRYVGLNPSHERRIGLRTADLQGKTPEQVLPPEVAAVVRQHYQDCVDAGESITYEECLPFLGQEIWWLTSLTPLRDENSRIYRIIGNCVNITERKRAEQMLDLQAVITRNMAEGICLIRSADGIIVYANPKFQQMFSYEPGELIGQHISIINYGDHQISPQDVSQAITNIVLEHGEVTCEVHNVKKDGTPFWCSSTVSVFEHPEYGTVFVAVQQDITEHKQAQEKITASLKEKEVLLKEIHHRVKNNLGIVSSLLQMHSRRTEDSQARAILRDSQNRIASIALVHEKLYRSEELADIDFTQYIPDLTTHLFDSYNVSSQQIKLNIQVDHVSLDIETAIPCGLIINELVSNALKYAFPNNINGEIQVKFYQECASWLENPGQYNFTLIIQDNGVGLPTEFDCKKTKTLGLTLVQGLVRQLQGNLEIISHQGTKFKITFTKGKE
jgi:PAS domain S-box-containing protein